jgi:large conductance mechanosensitive channel
MPGEPSTPPNNQPALPQPQRRGVRTVVTGFLDFIQTYSVLPLAIGVVVGSAVNDLVKSLVDGLISPLINLVTPGATLASFEVTIHDSVFKIGAVINALLNFISIALVVYVVVKLVLRRDLPKQP